MEASSSDKVRLSEIDAFGSSNPHSRTHTPTDFGSGNTGGARGPDGPPAGTGGGHAADTKGVDGPAMNAESLEATKQWLYRPCSKNSRPLECYVERERSGIAGSNTVFRLFNEQNHHTGQNSRFMMSAKKLKGKTTSYYLISMDMTPDDDRGSDTVLGRVRGNAVGSEYLFTDGGVTAGKTRLSSLIRKELGFVRFNFDSKGPSSTEVWVPNVTDGGAATIWQPEDPEEGMEAKIKANQVSDLKALKNKKPRWDAAHGGHVLNFHGRVTESSVKNFQLAFAGADENSLRDDVVLQFGKVSKDKFTLDYSWPLSPVQAFGICVASLDGKIADRKGYEFIRTTTNFLFGGSKDKKGAGGIGGKT
jgi:tubby-related protein 1